MSTPDPYSGLKLTQGVEWYVWRPHWPYEKANPNKCRASVPNGGRSVGFHQCRMGVMEQYAGYGWCRVHYKKVTDRLAPKEETVPCAKCNSRHHSIGLCPDNKETK